MFKVKYAVFLLSAYDLSKKYTWGSQQMSTPGYILCHSYDGVDVSFHKTGSLQKKAP